MFYTRFFEPLKRIRVIHNMFYSHFCVHTKISPTIKLFYFKCHPAGQILKWKKESANLLAELRNTIEENHLSKGVLKSKIFKLLSIMDKNLTLDDAVEFLVEIQGAFNRTDQQQICNDICHDKVTNENSVFWLTVFNRVSVKLLVCLYFTDISSEMNKNWKSLAVFFASHGHLLFQPFQTWSMLSDRHMILVYTLSMNLNYFVRKGLMDLLHVINRLRSDTKIAKNGCDRDTSCDKLYFHTREKYMAEIHCFWNGPFRGWWI